MAEYDALTAAPEDLDAEALAELLRAQQRDAASQRASLQETLSRQQAQAGQLRGLNLLTSLGDNPLLRGIQQSSGQQGAMLENNAARTESRLANVGRGGLDPAQALLRLYALRQGDKRIGLVESEAERKARAAAAAAAQRELDKATKDERFGIKLEGELRTKFEGSPAYKNFQIASVAYEQIQSAFKDPSAAGDIAGITSFMKSLDPETGVKDQEFNNASNAGGMYDKAAALLSKVKNGQRLTPEQRADFMRVANANVRALKRPHDMALKRYQDLAKSYKVDPGRVASPGSDIDLTVEPPKTTTKPPPAPSGRVAPGAPRSIKSSVTFTDPKDGKQKTLRTYADGRTTITED